METALWADSRSALMMVSRRLQIVKGIPGFIAQV